MAGFEEQLNSILGNQEAMSQIMALARSLSGEQPPGGQGEALPPPEAPGEEYIPAGEEPAPPPPPDLSALMGQVDPKLIQAGMEVLRQTQGAQDRNTALVSALRPFLREDRQARLDRALQLARTAKLVRAALSVMGGKEGERV